MVEFRILAASYTHTGLDLVELPFFYVGVWKNLCWVFLISNFFIWFRFLRQLD